MDTIDLLNDHAPTRVFTAGWLLKSTRRGVTLAARQDDSDLTCGQYSFIPRANIQKIEFIKGHDIQEKRRAKRR